MEDIRCKEEIHRQGRVGLRTRSQISRLSLGLLGEIERLVIKARHGRGCGETEEGSLVPGKATASQYP